MASCGDDLQDSWSTFADGSCGAAVGRGSLIAAALILVGLWALRRWGGGNDAEGQHPQRKLAGYTRLVKPPGKGYLAMDADGGLWKIATVVRYVWLVLALVGAAVLGQRARLQDSKHNILELELAGDWRTADRLDLDLQKIHSAISADWWFIPAYVVLLCGLVMWAGSHYRIQSVRELRINLMWAVVGAGVLDLIENACLAFGTGAWGADAYDQSTPGSWLWPIAAAAAWGKLTVLLGAAAFVVVGILACWWTPRALKVVLQGAPPAPDETTTQSKDRQNLGIALSGGGIRSASISLGALQQLELTQEKLGWDEAATVTAVSGGSNIAAGFSLGRSVLTTHQHLTAAGVETDLASQCQSCIVRKTAWSGGDRRALSKEEAYLQRNLGYLASNRPRGNAAVDPAAPQLGDDVEARQLAAKPTAYATVLTGFLLNVTVFGLILLLVARPLGWLVRWLIPSSDDIYARADLNIIAGQSRLVAPPLVLLAVGIAAIVLWVLFSKTSQIPGLKVLSRKGVLTAMKGLAYGGLGLGAALVVGLIGAPFLMYWLSDLGSFKASVVSVAASMGSLGAVVRILRQPLAKYTAWLGGIVFALLFAFLGLYWAQDAALAEGDAFSSDRQWWLTALVVLTTLYLFTSVEWWSLAPFYRAKLRLAFALRREDGRATPYRSDRDVTDDADREPALHEILVRSEPGDAGTPLVICTACTVSTRGTTTHYGIPAMSVTFSPSEVRMHQPRDERGRWDVFSCSTEQMARYCKRGNTSRMTTMLAVAISSAAVAPAMGRFRIGPTSMLLTFANVRLGAWMPNPRYVGKLSPNVEVGFPWVRMSYLFKEFLGIHDPTDLYVYLTDGGHWENTGLVELLRLGRYKEIVCVDADPGPRDAVGSISQAIELARLECGARVSLDLDPMRAEVKSTRAPEYAERTITYGLVEAMPAGDSVGKISILWYCKPALTKDMPAALLAHRETHADYPKISTMDQFFDTSTFVAYRDLGRYNARRIQACRSSLRDVVVQCADLADFEQKLATNVIRGWYAVELVKLIKDVDPEPAKQANVFEQVKEILT